MKRVFAVLLSVAASSALAQVSSRQFADLYARPSPFENVSPDRYIAESENAFAIRDKYPQAPVHVLIIPKKRVPTILQAPPQLISEMIALANLVAKQEGLEGDGFRLVINTHKSGGQDAYHLHIHLLGGRQMTWPPG